MQRNRPRTSPLKSRQGCQVLRLSHAHPSDSVQTAAGEGDDGKAGQPSFLTAHPDFHMRTHTHTTVKPCRTAAIYNFIPRSCLHTAYSIPPPVCILHTTSLVQSAYCTCHPSFLSAHCILHLCPVRTLHTSPLCPVCTLRASSLSCLHTAYSNPSSCLLTTFSISLSCLHSTGSTKILPGFFLPLSLL